jgi:hypothetical protein
MASTYKTPGVYVEEIQLLPPSVAEVETAIPAFIGYTVNNTYNGEILQNKPKRVKSLKEFEEIFGKALTTFTITLDASDNLQPITNPGLTYRMNYALKLYFANGGGPCYICSIGQFAAGDNSATILSATQAGLASVKKEDEPTILLFPDAQRMTEDGFYTIYKDALAQCAELGDRIVIVDVLNTGSEAFSAVEGSFRNKIGNNFLKYGAAYYPWLKTTMNYDYDEAAQVVSGGSISGANPVLRKFPDANGNIDEANSLFHQQNSKFNELYFKIKDAISKHLIQIPPSAAIAGVYAQVDANRGVWKAPANVSLNYVAEPLVNIDDADQKDMNVHPSGKSVNAIRNLSDKGIMVWGARTLAGNDNEWRYVNVRRFFNFVEESVRKATFSFVFEPNDANTWTRVRSMIENFLTLQWRTGALAGEKPEHAFFVRVGLGQTMTALDILEGRMNVEIGMAVVRPAEFIILKFSHKMQVS